MKVSIIVPVYNVEEYILECLNSVSSQTMTDGIECILIDDCGKDKSTQIIEEYINTYEGKGGIINFKFFYQERNQGPSAARNRGILEAQGEYIFFLDADDTITPDCIESLYTLAVKYNSEYVQGLYKHDNGKNYFTTYRLPECIDDTAKIKSTMLNSSAIHFTPHNKLVKRELILRNQLFFPENIIHEDAYWLFFMAKHIKKLIVCHKTTYFLRDNPHSLVHTENFELEVRSYKKLIEDCSKSVDEYIPGAQKEYLVNMLLIVLEKKYYRNQEEKCLLINYVNENNSTLEKILLSHVIHMNNAWLKTKLLHLLYRIMKRNDK